MVERQIREERCTMLFNVLSFLLNVRGTRIFLCVFRYTKFCEETFGDPRTCLTVCFNNFNSELDWIDILNAKNTMDIALKKENKIYVKEQIFMSHCYTSLNYSCQVCFYFSFALFSFCDFQRVTNILNQNFVFLLNNFRYRFIKDTWIILCITCHRLINFARFFVTFNLCHAGSCNFGGLFVFTELEF